MNPFMNPVFLFRLMKSYLQDVNRVWYTSLQDLRKYQDKQLRNMVRYAYTVPLYHQKYKEAGVHPNDIKEVKDLHKLPFITKNDLRSSFPNGLLPPQAASEIHFQLSTSGSTGKPVFLYIDQFAAIKRLEGFVRVLRAYGGEWRRSKTALVIDLSPGSVEHATYQESTLPFLKKIMSVDNIKYLHIGDPPEQIIKELNEFQPEFLGSDANMLRKLAKLKNDGIGKNIQPECMFAGGSMLDSYTKTYVEQAFGTRLFDVYGSTEAGPMAFECVDEKYYHVHSDFVLLEILDQQNNPVPDETPGKLVATRLYGHGTPIIRYTGIEDILVPSSHQTSCGITSEMLHHIEGRTADLLILPNGQLLSPLSITGIPAKVMEKHQSFIIDQFQIIQHSEDDIEVLVIINDKVKTKGTIVKIVIDDLHHEFQKNFGDEINVTIRQVDEIQKDARADYVKVVISKVKKSTKKK